MHIYKSREGFLTKIKREPKEINLSIKSNDMSSNHTEEQDLRNMVLKQDTKHLENSVF